MNNQVECVKNQVIIQARMGSTRLPGKTMMLLAGLPVLEHVVRRSSAAMLVNRVVVATTDLPGDDELERWCAENAVPCVRGSSEDVLARYILAVEKFPCENLVRITADCPLIDPGIIDALLSLHLDGNKDYTANVIPPTFPVGFDAEVVKSDVLRQVGEKATLNSHREHVTLYIRENLERFAVANLSYGKNYEHIRLTLDRDADYQLLQAVFAHFAASLPLFSFYQVMDFLLQNEHLIKINAQVDRFEGMNKSAAAENRKLKWQ